jgi:signal transduction histidine kinase
MDQTSGSRLSDRAVLDVPSAARLVGAVLDSLPLAVALLRVGSGYPIVHCNAVLDRWLPAEMHPVVGRRFVDIFDRPSERARARDVLDSVSGNGEPVHFRHYETVAATSRPLRTTLPGGLQIWTWDVFPIRSAAGAIDYLLSVGLDVTDSALAERRLVDGHQQAVNALVAVVENAEGRQSMTSFLGSVTESVAEVVGARRVAFLAAEGDTVRALGDAHGISADELRSIDAIPCSVEGNDLLAQVVHLGRTLHLGAHAQTRTSLVAIPVPFAVHDLVAVPWRAGERVLGALVAFNSTAESGFSEQAEWVMQASAIGAALVWRQRQVEAELEEQQRSEAQALRLHAARMAGLEKAKSEFLNLASHELRGPLSVVHGYVGLFLDGGFGPLAEEMGEAMNVVVAKLDEMRRLIDQLVDMARLEDRRLELARANTDLCELVRTAVVTMVPIVAERRRIALELPQTPVVVDIDGNRVLTVVMNLIGNALKYTAGEVRCTLRVDQTNATVDVADHGPGIQPEHRDALFTRFGRIVTDDNRHIGGTGLGLYLSRELARRHGGEVVYRPEQEGGSTFSLVLPLPSW